jgi:hypothetical protein
MVVIEMWKLGSSFSTSDTGRVGSYRADAVPRKHELIVFFSRVWHVIDVVHLADDVNQPNDEARHVVLLVLPEQRDELLSIPRRGAPTGGPYRGSGA